MTINIQGVQPPLWEIEEFDSISLLERFRLSTSNIPSSRRDRLKKLFSDILNDERVAIHLENLGEEKVSFDFDIHSGGFAMRFGTQEHWHIIVPFEEMIKDKDCSFKALYKEVREIERIARLTGIEPRKRSKSRVEKRIESIFLEKQAERGIELTQIPSKTPGRLARTIDANSFARNTTAAGVQFSSSAAADVFGTIVAGSQAAGGVMAVASGSILAYRSAKKVHNAYRHGDTEGGVHNSLQMTTGAAYSTVGAGMITAGVGTLKGTAAAVATGTTVFLTGGFVMNTALAIYAGIGWHITGEFREKLTEILQETNEPKRYRDALAWIQDQVTVSPFEAEEIRAKAKDAEEANKKIAKLADEKWDKFERRTNAKCGQMVRQNLIDFDAISKGIEVGHATSLDKAKEIVYEVEKANYKERVKYRLMMLIAIISLLGCALAIGFPPAAPFVFAIGALVWLTIDSPDLTDWIGEKQWNKHIASLEKIKYKEPIEGSSWQSATS